MSEEEEGPLPAESVDDSEERFFERIKGTVHSAFDEWVAKADEELHEEEEAKRATAEGKPELPANERDSERGEPDSRPDERSDAERARDAGRVGRKSFWERKGRKFLYGK